jgi:hypothetical protein
MDEGSYTWDRDRDDVARGAFGLWADLEDMAKFGQLLLQGGTVMYDGAVREIIPSFYFEEMTKTQSRMIGMDLPYGWQVWNWGEDDDGDSGFCAEGLGWQSICVFPKHDTVVAIQAPVSFGVETFAANIEFRNNAIKAIRDGIVCDPTAAPGGSPTSPPVSSTPAPSAGDNLVGDAIQDPIDGGDSNNGDNGGDSNNGNEDLDGYNGDIEDTDLENESEQVLIGSANGDDSAPVGLIIGLALLAALLCVVCTLFFCSKRSTKDRGAPRSVDCKIVPTGSQDDELNKMYEAKLNADDLSVDTDDDSGEIAYAVADIEQRSY